jgi:hypothetical protein
MYYATVGVQFDPNTGGGKGSKLYAYDPIGNSWAARASTMIDGDLVANEALAYDPVNDRLYATIVQVTTGGDAGLLSTLAIYDPDSDTWTGTTSGAGTTFGVASEAEYLDGKIYVWRGLFNGGAVNGSDSYLEVYDIATDDWSATPTLQSFGIVPGFRSGAIDIWGVALTADPQRNLLFVLGGEANKQVYVFDVTTQTWSVAPTAVYDGGWGDGLEYVSESEILYQIDGRNALGSPQGTAAMSADPADINGDGAVDVLDLLIVLAEWGPCANCDNCPADIDDDCEVGVTDLLALIAAWTPCD